MLEIPHGIADEIVAHCLRGLPEEACGLIAAAEGSSTVEAFYPTPNLAASALVYTVDPKAHLKADRAAEDAGLVICGVVHSHTRTEAYPSPTDVAQAPDPGWHYVIVSLRDQRPAMRSYRIAAGEIDEEPVALVGR